MKNLRITNSISRRSFTTYLAVSLSACSILEQSPKPFRFFDDNLSSKKTDNTLKIELQKILDEVNKKFIYESDENIDGEIDTWITASAESAWRGDCEDFALLCRKLLRDKGNANGMLLTCWTETGAYHCVLYIEGWILDYRYAWVMSNTDLQSTGYVWHKLGLPNGKWYYVESG